MRKLILVIAILFTVNGVRAQVPIVEVIKAGITKVIKAVDLRIQRLQNETIWLQNAQKTLENAMAKAKLGEIKEWVNKQRNLYAEYYDELWKVKETIANYHRIRSIISQQTRLVEGYRQVLRLIHADKHFSISEVEHMSGAYAGILQASLNDINQLFLAVTPHVTQMNDGGRISIINQVSEQMEEHCTDLLEFNQQNQLLSQQRARDAQDLEAVKTLYGTE